MAKPRTDDEPSPYRKNVSPDESGRCVWITQGRRCLQRGVYSPIVTSGKQSYCSWHAECLRNSKSVDDRERFDAFLGFLRNGLYCTVWTHFDHEVLWGSVYGEETSAKPEPCRNPSCSVRLDMERELGYLLPDQPPIPKEPLVHLLGRRQQEELPRGNRSAEEIADLERRRIGQLEALKRWTKGL
jgi:hypothetical protein